VRRSLSAHWTEPACTPVAIDRARIDRQIREFGDAARALGVDAYLARLKALRRQRDALTEQAVSGLSGHRAVEWLRALGETVQRADVEQLFRKSLALCAVLQAWQVDTNGHTYQLFVSRVPA
jgi:hypothetical protein